MLFKYLNKLNTFLITFKEIQNYTLKYGSIRY